MGAPWATQGWLSAIPDPCVTSGRPLASSLEGSVIVVTDEETRETGRLETWNPGCFSRSGSLFYLFKKFFALSFCLSREDGSPAAQHNGTIMKCR